MKKLFLSSFVFIAIFASGSVANAMTFTTESNGEPTHVGDTFKVDIYITPTEDEELPIYNIRNVMVGLSDQELVELDRVEYAENFSASSPAILPNNWGAVIIYSEYSGSPITSKQKIHIGTVYLKALGTGALQVELDGLTADEWSSTRENNRRPNVYSTRGENPDADGNTATFAIEPALLYSFGTELFVPDNTLMPVFIAEPIEDSEDALETLPDDSEIDLSEPSVSDEDSLSEGTLTTLPERADASVDEVLKESDNGTITMSVDSIVSYLPWILLVLITGIFVLMQFKKK